MSEIKRIGVLTGGGDCPGLNAVIRAVTKAAIFNNDWEVFGIADGYLGLIEDRVRPLRANDVSNILTVGGTILGSSNKANPERFATGTNPDGSVRFENVCGRCFDTIKKHRLDAIVAIGGDGTMSGAKVFIEAGVNIIGVPKTIDNDLVGTDLTFGFMTACSIATEALDRIHTTAQSHARVMIVEVMGRNAGWIALHSGVASGADIILLPEFPYSLDAIAKYLHHREAIGRNFTVICAAEGAHEEGGSMSISQIDPTSPDPVRLGGVAHLLAKQIQERTGRESRAAVLGHVQRGGSPIAADRVLATRFGRHATALLRAGKRNRLVAMVDGKVTDVDLALAADKQRVILPDNELMEAAVSVGTSFGVNT
jgi:6-phosphofructokinase 1